MMAVTAAVLVGVVGGCSSSPGVQGGSVSACSAFAAAAIRRQVTVTALPSACQSLSRAEVNEAVNRALRAAVAGVHGKARQRQLIGRDAPYVSALIKAVPATSPPAVAEPSAGPPSQTALGLATLAAWLVTTGLGISMLARWITRARLGRGAARNFAHLGLAVTGLGTWIGYLATGVAGLAWAGCGLLVGAASLGMTLVFLAPAQEHQDTTPDPYTASDQYTARTRDASSVRPPPALLVGVHITAAVVTILLAALTAAGSG